MKYFAIIFCLVIFSFSTFSQITDKVLATANGFTITSKDLPASIQENYMNFPKLIAEKRKALLDEQIAEVLLEVEANERKISVEKLVETEVSAKVSTPNDEQIKTIYELNRAQLDNKTLEEVRPQIIAFLRREPEQKAYSNLFTQLKAKHKITFGKDVNAPNLKPSEVLVTIGTKPNTVKDYDERNKPKIADFEGNFYDQIKAELDEVLFNTLVSAEAKAQNIGAGDLIAREITDKMREFSDAEREQLEGNLRNKLFTKYNVKILFEEPKSFVQNISTDDDPAQGNANAPVTVVMFSDFQCPACSAVHPVLKNVIARYGDKVRFVVRDFPLTIHKNAFRAALAANAANAQGKYFEYTEILYKNQENLDDESLKKYAADLGLNIKQFALDLENEKFAEEVRKDMADGKSYGIGGTPTIYVNGVKVRTLSAASFKNAIEKALKK
jgi:predicted DsbA family dithiol-disulfide isomerase